MKSFEVLLRDFHSNLSILQESDGYFCELFLINSSQQYNI